MVKVWALMQLCEALGCYICMRDCGLLCIRDSGLLSVLQNSQHVYYENDLVIGHLIKMRVDKQSHLSSCTTNRLPMFLLPANE